MLRTVQHVPEDGAGTNSPGPCTKFIGVRAGLEGESAARRGQRLGYQEPEAPPPENPLEKDVFAEEELAA